MGIRCTSRLSVYLHIRAERGREKPEIKGFPSLGQFVLRVMGTLFFCLRELIYIRKMAGLRLLFYYLGKREYDFTILGEARIRFYYLRGLWL